MDKSSSLRTPIKRARGLGAAHSGTHHFWLQRVSAVALVPLSIWFMIQLVGNLIGGDVALITHWLSDPLRALLLAAFIIAMFMHARLGVQVIIEDYVHFEGKKIFCLLLLNALIYGFGAAALMGIMRLHFFGI
ncbi:MAG: succinate dehydrogenase, hydrophobic membrane anchor protein [Rickettsiales bacterium]